MKIKSRKNEYNYDVVDCPFCDNWVYLRVATKISPDPLRDLKRHITNHAKNEAFAVALGESVFTTHLDYYKSHTKLQPIKPILMKRGYDKDLSI